MGKQTIKTDKYGGSCGTKIPFFVGFIQSIEAQILVNRGIVFNPRLWQIITIIFVIILVPTVIIPAVSDLITQGIQSAGSTINEILRPLSDHGEERPKGLVRLCLYLIFITVVVKFFIKNKGN